MSTIVFACRFDWYVSSSGGGSYPIVYFESGGGGVALIGPDSGGTFDQLTVRIGTEGLSTMFDDYTVDDFHFLTDTWYTIELKAINSQGVGGDPTAWLKIYDGTMISTVGPFPPDSTEAAGTTSFLGGGVFIRFNAPDLGGSNTAPHLTDDVVVAHGNWISEGGILVFADNFETYDPPGDTAASFVPPSSNWVDAAINFNGAGPGPFLPSGHEPDPADSSNTIASLNNTGDFIMWENDAVPGSTGYAIAAGFGVATS